MKTRCTFDYIVTFTEKVSILLKVWKTIFHCQTCWENAYLIGAPVKALKPINSDSTRMLQEIMINTPVLC